MIKFAVIIEKTENNFSAFSPDIPGCAATGKTIKETLQRMEEAIRFHIVGLREEGLPVPEPSSKVRYIEISL